MDRPECKVFLCTERAFNYGTPAAPLFYCEEHAQELGLSARGASFDDQVAPSSIEKVRAAEAARLSGPEVLPAAPFTPRPDPTPPSTPQSKRKFTADTLARELESRLHPTTSKPPVPPPSRPAPPPAVTKEIPMPAAGWGRQVLCVDTNWTYPNVQAAAEAHGIAKGTLGAALAPSGNGKAGGKSWKWAGPAAISSPAPRPRKPRRTPAPPSAPATPATPALARAVAPSLAPPPTSLLGSVLTLALNLASAQGGKVNDLKIAIEQNGQKITLQAQSLEILVGSI
jgi:hypothetical protein